MLSLQDAIVLLLFPVVPCLVLVGLIWFLIIKPSVNKRMNKETLDAQEALPRPETPLSASAPQWDIKTAGGADPESALSYFLNTQPRTKDDYIKEVSIVADNPEGMFCSEFEPHIPELDGIPGLPAMSTALDVYISKNHFYLYGKKMGGLSKAIGSVGLLGPILGGIVSTFADEDEIILKVPWSDVIWVKADKRNQRVIILAKVNGEKFLMPITHMFPGETINKLIDLLEIYVDVETTKIEPYDHMTL